MNNGTQNTAGLGSVEMPALDKSQSPSLRFDEKPVGLIISMVVCAVLAVAGIGFGVYAFTDSDQKNQQIAELEATVDNKESEIEKLETKISILELETTVSTSEEETTDSKPATAPETTDETATIALGDIIDENEERTVYKIGDCTSDGPSTKCMSIVNGNKVLISFLTTDEVLRLVLPKEADSKSTTNSNETATIALGAIITENDERTVFKIGDCTSDGPSTKCHVEVNGKQALISHLDTDNILRLVISKE